jgi:hypothetical protein
VNQVGRRTQSRKMMLISSRKFTRYVVKSNTISSRCTSTTDGVIDPKFDKTAELYMPVSFYEALGSSLLSQRYLRSVILDTCRTRHITAVIADIELTLGELMLWIAISAEHLFNCFRDHHVQ